LENQQAGNVEVATEDLEEISQLLEKYPMKGGRYVDAIEEQLHLWNWDMEKLDFCIRIRAPPARGIREAPLLF
jgi:hypothetical protein